MEISKELYQELKDFLIAHNNSIQINWDAGNDSTCVDCEFDNSDFIHEVIHHFDLPNATGGYAEYGNGTINLVNDEIVIDIINEKVDPETSETLEIDAEDIIKKLKQRGIMLDFLNEKFHHDFTIQLYLNEDDLDLWINDSTIKGFRYNNSNLKTITEHFEDKNNVIYDTVREESINKVCEYHNLSWNTTVFDFIYKGDFNEGSFTIDVNIYTTTREEEIIEETIKIEDYD